MIVFAGPSVSGVDLGAYSGVEFRPPVRQGDVYLATLDAPAAIGIIDGYFEGVPAVWHKEVLWALAQGIPVLGAASMGALRAAELDVCGMIGVGAIYEAYRDGVYEDDDEVALVHGPAELGSPPLSLAMANVRATIIAAQEAGILNAEQANDLVAAAKAQFYKTRTWETVFAHAPVGFPAWLENNEVDQKKRDAIALLDRMVLGDLPEASLDEPFEVTQLWARNTRSWRRRQERAPVPEGAYSLLGDQDLYRDR
jgi:hypothetical protein